MENKRMIPTGIYGITDSKSGAAKDITAYSEELLKGGVKVLQYREKKKSAKAKFAEALALRELTRRYNAVFIVNDDISIAMAVGADGVHIGQDDLPIKEVRKLVGEDMIIGLSTHNPEEAKKAVADGADYIGVGPIFNTATKEDVCAPLGFSYLEYVQANLDIPYVAIGGIKFHNIDEIIDRGAVRISVVSELVGADDTYKATKKMTNYLISRGIN